MYRRTRKPNYTHEETMALLEQIDAHKHILFGKATNHQRLGMWAVIADAVNAVPTSAGRTIDELKHRWKDMSHRARLSARNISEKKPISNNDKAGAGAAPSMYFDMVMKIIGGEDIDISDFTMGFSNDSQSSASGHNEESHGGDLGKGEDVKPDINQINGFIKEDSATSSTGVISSNSSVHTSTPITASNNKSVPDSNITPVKKSTYPPQTCESAPDQTAAAKSVKKHSIPAGLFVRPKRKRKASNPSSYPGDSIPQSKTFAVSDQDKKAPQSRVSTQVPISRPMRLDPETQEVLEIEGYEFDSESTEDETVDPKIMVTPSRKNGRTSDRKVARGPTDKHLLTASKSMPHSPATHQLENDESSLMALPLNELRKLYFARKIQMVNHRTSCYRLLEQKLQCELNKLQDQTLPESHQFGPTTSTCHRIKKKKVAAAEEDDYYDDADDDEYDAEVNGNTEWKRGRSENFHPDPENEANDDDSDGNRNEEENYDSNDQFNQNSEDNGDSLEENPHPEVYSFKQGTNRNNVKINIVSRSHPLNTEDVSI